MSCPSKARALIACFGLAILFTGFSARLVYIQVYKHDEYTAIALSTHGHRQTIGARRGVIEDVNGEILADTEMFKTIVRDSKDPVIGAPDTAEILARKLKLDQAGVLGILTGPAHYAVLKTHVPDSLANEIADEIEERNGGTRHIRTLGGIRMDPEPSRFYPNGPMLCHVIGFVDHNLQNEPDKPEKHEISGIERSMGQYLRGHDGFRDIERDRKGDEIVPFRGDDHPARNGLNIRLTIDMSIQNIVEHELDAAVSEFKPEMAVGIVMRPKTGEILALANRPNFDLNDFGKSAPDSMINRAVASMLEPGSTFKIVTASGALNEHLVRPDTTIFCNNGSFSYGGRVLTDHKPYGDLSIDEILMKSSNIGAAKMALMLGDQRFYEYMKRFGFGERTGVSLPGEISGTVHPLHQWNKISITRVAMGQEVAVTPLQMITAMSAIANGGHLMMPQIIHEITDEQGAVRVSYPPVEVRQVVSPETAAMVREALKSVVSAKGTAAAAAVPGFTVAGKTGTAQKAGLKGVGYLKGKYILSFIGFLPADDPEFVCLVVLDDAKTQTKEEEYGGVVSAPIFARIAEKTAAYMNLEPHPDEGKIVMAPAQHH